MIEPFDKRSLTKAKRSTWKSIVFFVGRVVLISIGTLVVLTVIWYDGVKHGYEKAGKHIGQNAAQQKGSI